MMVSYTDSEYTGTMVAYGGSSDYSYGGAGTIYTVEDGSKKKIIVDNGEPYTVTVTKLTVLPAKSDSDVMFCLQSYQGLAIDRSLMY